jgi:HEAT repeat protein
MLGDAEPAVQRDTIRAIVEIGTEEAYALLEQQLLADGPGRDAMLRQLMGLRDEKAIPLLCHVLRHTSPRGKTMQMHASIVTALGNFRGNAQALGTLEEILYRGWWWAPRRTSMLRQAAAEALRRIGTAESFAVLEQAASRGGGGVRRAVRPHLAAAPRHAVTR